MSPRRHPIARPLAAIAATPPATKAHPPSAPGDRIADECTASAGFWAPADEGEGEAAPGEPRKLVCKRYA